MANNKANILVVDDDADVRTTAELLLAREGFKVYSAKDPSEALSRLVSDQVDLILLDLNFSRNQSSGAEGLACLDQIMRHDAGAIVLVVTGHSGLNIAVQALRAGARDFIMKPWNNQRLVQAIESALAKRRLARIEAPDPSMLVGQSESMRRISSAIDKSAPLTAPVLLTGEPGSGKTLAAVAIHRQSGRTRWTSVEASALLPSHLDDGPDLTLLIENVDRLPEAMVPNLLAWLNRAPRQNSRLVSSSVRGRTELGLDRGLSYAISTIDIEMPPLRDRSSDVPLLAEHFVRVTCQHHGFAAKSLTPEAMALLVAQEWPDNIHAMKHVVERAALLTDGSVISGADLSLHTSRSLDSDGKASLAGAEKEVIEEALKRCNFNVSAAAVELGLTRPALYRRMSKHGI